MDVIMEMAAGGPYFDRLRELRRFLEDSSLYEDLKTGGHVPISEVTDDDVQAMLTAGLITEVDDGDSNKCKRFAKFLSVYEGRKHRRRGILWPKELNDLIRWTFSVL
eukprot:PhF_6_TR28501/c0_g1_i1/m.42104